MKRSPHDEKIMVPMRAGDMPATGFALFSLRLPGGTIKQHPGGPFRKLSAILSLSTQLNEKECNHTQFTRLLPFFAVNPSKRYQQTASAACNVLHYVIIIT
jgi:hypothetical protein